MDAIVRGKPWRGVPLAVALSAVCGVRAERYQAVDNASTTPPAASAPAAPAPADATTDVQVVVLQDGGVMQGRLTRSGDRFVFVRQNGQTFVPASKVLLVAATLDEAYHKQRARLAPTTADTHLALAEWCLRNDLPAFARRELDEARALEPRHGQLDFFERRLALAVLRKTRQAAPVAATPTASPPISISTPAVTTDIGDLPPGAVERFTRKVQPVLVNNCTLGGCHQRGGSQKFQLERAVLHGMANRRSTMSNLAATLELVDRQQPQQSPLLTVPRQTHGGMKEPILGPRRDAAFRHLYDWVALVTASATTPTSTEPTEPSETPPVSQESADADASTAADDSPIPLADDSTGAQPPLRYGTRLVRWQPRDEFDPEIFNRKYAAQAQDYEASPASAPGEPAELALPPIRDAQD